MNHDVILFMHILKWWQSWINMLNHPNVNLFVLWIPIPSRKINDVTHCLSSELVMVAKLPARNSAMSNVRSMLMISVFFWEEIVTSTTLQAFGPFRNVCLQDSDWETVNREVGETFRNNLKIIQAPLLYSSILARDIDTGFFFTNLCDMEKNIYGQICNAYKYRGLLKCWKNVSGCVVAHLWQFSFRVVLSWFSGGLLWLIKI